MFRGRFRKIFGTFCVEAILKMTESPAYRRAGKFQASNEFQFSMSEKVSGLEFDD
jgi:hypothetical protein